jgi:hypothetical protein
LKGNPTLGTQLGQNGRKYIVEKFSRVVTADKYVEVLGRLITNPVR